MLSVKTPSGSEVNILDRRELQKKPYGNRKHTSASVSQMTAEEKAKVASPGELATMCLDLISSSPEGVEAAELLIARLVVWIERKDSMGGFIT